MSKPINVKAIDPKKLKTKTIAFNIVIALICAAMIFVVIFGDFLKVNVSVVLDDKMIESMTDGTPETVVSKNADASGTQTDPPSESEAPKIDLSGIPEKDRTVSLSLTIGSRTALNSVVRDTAGIVDGVIEAQVERLIRQVKPLVIKIVRIAAKAAVAIVLDECRTELEKTIGDVDAFLKEKGIDPATLNADIDGIIDDLSADQVDTEKIKNDALSIIDRVATAAGTQADGETKQQFEEAYDAIITNSIGADGSLDIAKLFENVMNITQGMSGTATPKTTAYRAAARAAGTEATEESINAELKTQLMAQIDGDTAAVIGLGFRILGILEAVMILLWAFVLVKVIVKTFFGKNKTVRFSAAAIPSFILMLALFATSVAVVFMILPSVAGASGVGLNIVSGVGIVLGAASLALFVLWLAGYRKCRKQAKALAHYAPAADPDFSAKVEAQ